MADEISEFGGTSIKTPLALGTDGKFPRRANTRKPTSPDKKPAGSDTAEIFSLNPEKITTQIAAKLLKTDFLKEAPESLSGFKAALNSIKQGKKLTTEEKTELTRGISLEAEGSNSALPYKNDGSWRTRYNFEKTAREAGVLEYRGAVRG